MGTSRYAYVGSARTLRLPLCPLMALSHGTVNPAIIPDHGVVPPPTLAMAERSDVVATNGGRLYVAAMRAQAARASRAGSDTTYEQQLWNSSGCHGNGIKHYLAHLKQLEKSSSTSTSTSHRASELASASEDMCRSWPVSALAFLSSNGLLDPEWHRQRGRLTGHPRAQTGAAPRGEGGR
mmetsp:Transcript_9076/g.28738  ORF Transcript_9076/g.28738 Transcript_9076/m.28738 type:complete len:180 (+) Transcript_9076:544-1083(+)